MASISRGVGLEWPEARGALGTWSGWRRSAVSGVAEMDGAPVGGGAGVGGAIDSDGGA